MLLDDRHNESDKPLPGTDQDGASSTDARHHEPRLSDELLTPEEAAERLKVSPEHIRALIRNGRLPATNIGTGSKRPLYRIRESAIAAFLAAGLQPARHERPRRLKRLPPVEDHFPHLR